MLFSKENAQIIQELKYYDGSKMQPIRQRVSVISAGI